MVNVHTHIKIHAEKLYSIGLTLIIIAFGPSAAVRILECEFGTGMASVRTWLNSEGVAVVPAQTRKRFLAWIFAHGPVSSN